MLEFLFDDSTIEILFFDVVVPALVGGVAGLFVALIRGSRLVKGLWMGALVGAACGLLWILCVSSVISRF
jgi:hypothetical protein